VSGEPGAGEDAVIFRGSNGLWIMLTVLAALVLLLTLWIAIASLASDGAGALPGILLKGGVVVALLALAAWFSARQRREVVLDSAGVTVRAGDGSVRAQVAWPEIARIEERRMPSQPLHPAVILHRFNGTALLIDPQQVRDTGALAREAQRRHKGTESRGPRAEEGRRA
jgi:hypothetical protein